MKKNEGYAAILLVFVIGLVSLFLSLILLDSGFIESIGGRNIARSTQAFYAAQSGVEEMFVRLRQDQNFGVGGATYSLSIPFDGAVSAADVTVTSSTSSARTVTSVGSFNSYVRRVVAELINTTVLPGFSYAIHGGSNGVEISNSTVTGNVISNNYIRGDKNSHDKESDGGACKTSAVARIEGDAYAVDTIGKLATNDSGPCITGAASSAHLNECWVVGDRISPNSVPVECGGMVSPPMSDDAPTPVPFPLSESQINTLKSSLENRGTVIDGNCVINGTANPVNCGGLTNTIGNMVINGNLTVNSNNTLTITQPVWVKGTITFNSNVLVTTTATSGQIVLTDQPMAISSNTAFGHNGNAYLLFVSSYTLYPSPSPTPVPGPTSPFCDTPAITISSNTSNVLFFAPYGCALVNSNANFNGSLVADKVVVVNNSSVSYDNNLINASFSTSQQGGWQIQSFKEY